jgi:hypothetical protein
MVRLIELLELARGMIEELKSFEELQDLKEVESVIEEAMIGGVLKVEEASLMALWAIDKFDCSCHLPFMSQLALHLFGLCLGDMSRAARIFIAEDQVEEIASTDYLDVDSEEERRLRLRVVQVLV